MPLSKYDIELDLAANPDTSHAYMVQMAGSNKRILDVGCDTGYMGERLIALGNSVCGVEFNPVAAEEAAKTLERVVVADLEKVDLVEEFGPASFDVVIFGDVLEHLRDPLPVLRSARRLLAPGGSVIISVPNIAHGDVRLALLKGRFDYTSVGLLDDTHTRFFTRDSLVQFLADAGFVLADLQRTSAELFTTEIKLAESDFDPALVAELRADREATTYQFVARAVPDDATSLETTQALVVDELRTAKRRLEKELAASDATMGELRAALAERDRQIDTLKARVVEVQTAHDNAVYERDMLLRRDATPTLAARLRRRLRGS